MTDAHEDLDPVRVCERLITTAKLLYAQCEGCVVNHYAHDFATQGAPGWLADCAADIEAAQALGARAMKAACEAAGAKPVATVRVTHAGFGMELSTHVAYALPEGSHNLYAHPPAVAAGRVKALEWLDDGCDGVVADTPIGSYELHKTGYVDDEEIELSINLNRVVGMFGSTEDDLARAAAQTDYEQRILSALEGGGAQEVIVGCDLSSGPDMEVHATARYEGGRVTVESIEQITPAPGQHAGLVERVRFKPSECYAGCDDPECPYVHGEGWICKGIEGFFSSREDALEAAITALEADKKAKDAELTTVRLALERTCAREIAEASRATAAEAELAALRGEVEGRHGEPPRDGVPFLGMDVYSMRWTPYSKKSDQYRRGIAGRWQRAGAYGGWENCDRPSSWKPDPQYAALATAKEG